jgi:hypothetical protein
MAVMVNSGRAAIAAAIANEPIHLAWGTGDAAWDETPAPEPVDATALENEVGRRTASVIGFCTPDEAGEIVTQDGRFTESSEPTKYLFFRFSFDFSDGGDVSVRELGVFLDTQTDPGLPPGQMYFTPAEVIDPGALLLLERISATPQTPNTRTTYETVFQI